MRFRGHFSSLKDGLLAVNERIRSRAILEAIDIYEELVEAYPEKGVELLANLYDLYQTFPSKDRYTLYQARHFDFAIGDTDKVLDIGSGHKPFPLATHLADFSLTDHQHGRGGAPFKYIEGKPVYECNVDKMPFADKEFDFVYCSHVLEHVDDPEKACRELMRVGRRGYLESPSRGKDVFMAAARVSNHRWGLESFNGRLIFTEYSERDREGLGTEILQNMHGCPQTIREKAFAALIWLKADAVNVMMMWEDAFEFEIRRLDPEQREPRLPVEIKSAAGIEAALGEGGCNQRASGKLKFMQVHLLYPSYLDQFYNNHPHLSRVSFRKQVDAIVRDGFAGVHIFTPYLAELGYESQLVIANNPHSQGHWLKENRQSLTNQKDWIREVVRRQIEKFQPDVLYLTDPGALESNFVRSVDWKPRLVMGWRAANVDQGTDWSAFDVILSSLEAMRVMALQLGARSVEHFFPGFPVWISGAVADVRPEFDVVFSGQWTLTQHPRRNRYLQVVADAATHEADGFSCAYYLGGQVDTITPNVARFNHGARFGLAMHRALRSGRINLDARGILQIWDGKLQTMVDLAGKETANMRIFEATGTGVFLLTEYFDNLKNYFKPGIEIETFRDEKELLDKIRYYIAHPNEREVIAQRGQKRCFEEYSIQKRAAVMDQIIRRKLKLKYEHY